MQLLENQIVALVSGEIYIENTASFHEDAQILEAL